MNKLFILLTLTLLLVGGMTVLTPVHAQTFNHSPVIMQNSTSNQTQNQTQQRTPQQNETALMTVQLVGYSKIYGLYVTAPSNKAVPFLQHFYLNVTSQGNSTVTVYSGTTQIYRQSGWSWNTTTAVIDVNTTGTVFLSVVLQSSLTGLSRTIVYELQFETTTQYVSYYNQQVESPVQKFVSEATSEVTSVSSNMIGVAEGVGFLLFWYFRESLSPKGNTLLTPYEKRRKNANRNRG